MDQTGKRLTFSEGYYAVKRRCEEAAYFRIVGHDSFPCNLYMAMMRDHDLKPQ